jgi:hypothetical protein
LDIPGFGENEAALFSEAVKSGPETLKKLIIFIKNTNISIEKLNIFIEKVTFFIRRTP